MATQEITPSAPKLDKVIHRIEDGDIKIPPFQRGFVWDLEQVLSLLDSIYHDYPIGVILLWTTMQRLKAQRNLGGFLLPERPDEYPVNYVLDGQQRLSTIYAVFGPEKRVDSENAKYPVDTDMFDVYLDLDDDEFLHRGNLDNSHRNLRLSTLFDSHAFYEEVNRLPDDYRKKAIEANSRFLNYEIPMIATHKRAKEEVGVIFERINNTGTSLNTLDLMVAWTWDDDFHLKDRIDELLETLDAKSFGDLPSKILLQCISGIISKDTSTRAILSLPPADVKDKFQTVQDSMEKVIDFLS